LIHIYQQLQHIFLISLNDIFLSQNIDWLKDDKLICDSTQILKEYEYNFHKIMTELKSFKEGDHNLFFKISNDINEILDNKVIQNYNINEEKTNDKVKVNFKKKKNHEVDKLSKFIKEIIQGEEVNNLLEMGCGKSYMTDHIMNNDKTLYIGIDMKEDLVEKTNKMFNQDNCHIIYANVTAQNFQQIYDERIKDLIKSKGNDENNIFLFGLHSCGNLTSDTLKLYVKYPCFSHVAIVGCCLNLLKEYISKEAQETKIFKEYIKGVGYDSKGSFLEQTLFYDYNEGNVGYPLSKYILTNHPTCFLSRTVRNSAMQSISEHYDIKSLFFKKIYYRSVLQSFFEHFIPDLKMFYGIGKIELKENDSFYEYFLCAMKNIIKTFRGRNDKSMQEKLEIVTNELTKEKINGFAEGLLQFENILWSTYLLRLRFAKVVEYLIAFDRVVYLKENGTKNVKIIKIFDENLSVRNILIYSKKSE
jgi:hypothetical protein